MPIAQEGPPLWLLFVTSSAAGGMIAAIANGVFNWFFEPRKTKLSTQAKQLERFQEMQAKATIEVFQKLVTYVAAVKAVKAPTRREDLTPSSISPGRQALKAAVDLALEAHGDFEKHFLTVRIFFPKPLVDRINDSVMGIRSLLSVYQMAYADGYEDLKILGIDFENFERDMRSYNKMADNILQALQDRFYELMTGKPIEPKPSRLTDGLSSALKTVASKPIKVFKFAWDDFQKDMFHPPEGQAAPAPESPPSRGTSGSSPDRTPSN